MDAMQFLQQQEGFRARPYHDNLRGVLTFGYGLTYITAVEAAWILQRRVREIELTLHELFDFDAQILEAARWVALISMCYQLGSFEKYPRFVLAVEAQDWDKAADEMLYADPLAVPREESLWHQQTPRRCEMEAEMVRTGEFPTTLNAK